MGPSLLPTSSAAAIEGSSTAALLLKLLLLSCVPCGRGVASSPTAVTGEKGSSSEPGTTCARSKGSARRSLWALPCAPALLLLLGVGRVGGGTAAAVAE
jgi:hypothetical protein